MPNKPKTKRELVKNFFLSLKCKKYKVITEIDIRETRIPWEVLVSNTQSSESKNKIK